MGTIRFDLSKITDWTRALTDKKPPYPQDQVYYAKFSKSPGYELTYVAAEHVDVRRYPKPTKSPTFKMVERIISKGNFGSVILEGLRYRETDKDNISGYLNHCRKLKASRSFTALGENGWAALLASQKKPPIRVCGGEPPDAEIKAYLVARGYTSEDVDFFYLLREITSLQREGAFSQGALEARAGGCVVGKPLNLADFSDWYKIKNKTTVSPQELSNKEAAEVVAPFYDGELFTQKLSATLERCRNASVLKAIEAELNEYQKVLTIYGRGHLAVQLGTLQGELGKPNLYSWIAA